MPSSPSWNKIALLKNVLQKETGAIVKPWGGRLPIALIYPNTYYAGMSNLGLQTLYRLFNAYPEIVCERAFVEPGGAPDESGLDEWVRADSGRRKPSPGHSQSMPLVSLESQRPLDEFFALAYTVSYELDYLNVVHSLRQAGLPLLSIERDDRHPLVLAGGPCLTANPEPLAPFIDCVAIGEGEVIVPTIVDVFRDCQSQSRDVMLQKLAEQPGLYVPRFPRPVQRQALSDLNTYQTTSTVLTTQTELGDMYLMEIARGCARGCRFCLAGYNFMPMRWRDVDGLIESAQAGLVHRNRIGLVGAAVSDHPQIDELIGRLRAMDARIAVSSIRVERLSDLLVQALVDSGVQTLTIAPEAATSSLRRVIAKGLRDEQIERAVDVAGRRGVRKLKLYFMIGLPSETDDDVTAIVDLSVRLRERLHKHANAGQVVVHLTPFVPKAGTPFQWQAMAPRHVLEERLNVIRRALSSQSIPCRAESPAWSIIQGFLARGDAEIGTVLSRVEKNSLASWTRAIREAGVDIDHYLYRERDLAEPLPWAHIDSTVQPGILLREHGRASRHNE